MVFHTRSVDLSVQACQYTTGIQTYRLDGLGSLEGLE